MHFHEMIMMLKNDVGELIIYNILLFSIFKL